MVLRWNADVLEVTFISTEEKKHVFLNATFTSHKQTTVLVCVSALEPAEERWESPGLSEARP